jgi:small subunit ribosomal protein S6
MRKYELMVLLQPDLEEAALEEVTNKITGWVTDSGGTVDKVSDWGIRRMAYLIKNQRDSHYILFDLSLLPASTRELNRNIRFIEPVMRHMLSVVE